MKLFAGIILDIIIIIFLFAQLMAGNTLGAALMFEALFPFALGALIIQFAAAAYRLGKRYGQIEEKSVIKAVLVKKIICFAALVLFAAVNALIFCKSYNISVNTRGFFGPAREFLRFFGGWYIPFTVLGVFTSLKSAKVINRHEKSFYGVLFNIVSVFPFWDIILLKGTLKGKKK